MVAAGGEKLRRLFSEERPGLGVVQEFCNAPDPICPVEIVDHGEDFHAGVFQIEKFHDAVIDGENFGAFHHIEEFVGLVVYGLEVAIGGEHVQPIGIEYVDLAGVVAEGRKAGGVPRNVECGADAFFLIEFDL